MHETSTRSPAWSVRTPLPTASTVPTASCPRIRPSVTAGTSPLRMCRLVPQIVVVSIWTIASVGSTIDGSSAVSQERTPGPPNTSAFIDVSPSLRVCRADARAIRLYRPRSLRFPEGFNLGHLSPYRSDERVDVGFGRVPRAHPADLAGALIPHVERELVL